MAPPQQQRRQRQQLQQEAEISVHIGEGMDMAALTWGDCAAARRILCVHGWMDNAGSFGNTECASHAGEAAAADGLGCRLARDLGAYVVACDLLGHGHSSHQPGGFYTNASWAVQLLKFADTLGWDDGRQFTLIGHSMGQEICSLLAAAFPERVSDFVMLDGCGPWVMPAKWMQHMARQPAKTLRAAAKTWRKRNEYHEKPRAFASYEDVLGARLSKKFSSAGISRHAAAAITRHGTHTDAHTGKILYTHDPRVQLTPLEPNGYTEEQACQLLSEVPRTLAIMARSGIGLTETEAESQDAESEEEDSRADSDEASEDDDDGGAMDSAGDDINDMEDDDSMVKKFFQRRAPHFKDLQVVWVQGGHHVHLDTPEPVTRAIVEFLRQETEPALSMPAAKM